MRPEHWLYTIPLRLRSLFRRTRVEAELDEELRYHVDRLTEEHVARGLAPDEARAAAMRAMQGLEQRKEECRDARRVRLLEDAAADLRYGVRGLRRDARFALVAIVTLALGVGLNTAVFSIVNAVMLRELPYPDAGRLVALWEENSRGTPDRMVTSGARLGGASGFGRMSVSPANLPDYRSRTTAFTGLAGCALTAANLVGSGPPDRLWGEVVTANFFQVLGVRPLHGRDLVVEDDREDARPVVILAYEAWQRRFGGDLKVLGRTIVLDDRPREVVGVLPPGFQSPWQLAVADRLEFYVPAAFPKELLASRGDHEIAVVGRLKPGVSIATAQAQLDAISSALASEFPASNRYIRAAIAGLRDDLVRDVRTSLLVLLGAVGLIVLITCVDVSNLTLVRAISRQHETRVRLALGASRGRVVRQFLAESLLLSIVGCAAGLLLGRATLQLLVLAAPPGIPRLNSVTMDWRVFAVSALVAGISAIASAVLPAWHVSGTQPAESLKGAGRARAPRSHLRWRAALTTAEISISLVLLVGAGLLLKSFATVVGMDLGFRTANVVAANVNLPELRYRNQVERLRFFEQLEQRVKALPGVEAVTVANRMPMRGGWSGGFLLDDGGTQFLESDFQAVSPGYFDALGIGLVRGRLFTAADRDGQPPVAIVNRAFARRFFPGQDPIGRRFRRHAQAPWIAIIGVVGDVRRSGKTGEINPGVYLSALQTTLYPVRLADLAVRTTGDPRLLVGAVQSLVWAIDSNQPVTNIRTLDEIVSMSVAERRFNMLLLLAFAGVAVALALVGIFGVIAYSVTQRTTEFGVRLALGAQSRAIVALVLRQAVVLIGAGVVIGLAGAWALTRYLQSLLFEVRPTDAVTYLATAGLLVVVSLAASAIPAIRGARVDPLVALRYE